MPSEQFLKTHWHATNRPRWVNTRHIIWFTPSVEPDAGADVYLTCDDDTTHEFIAVNETPDELIDQLTALIDQPSPDSDPAHD